MNIEGILFQAENTYMQLLFQLIGYLLACSGAELCCRIFHIAL